MKLIKKLILTLCVLLGTSCTLDLREDPNSVQPDEILPSLVLNSMQRNLAALFQTASTFGMEMTRLQNAGGATYDRSTTPETFDGMWSTAYASILSDANELIASADELGYARHAGIARVIQAYTIMLLVDYFGDVPFSAAFQGSANFNPALDDQADLYNQVIDILDQARLDLTTLFPTSVPAGYLNPVTPGITDMYYNNNYTRWVRLANTLKLKAYLNLGDVTAINALIAESTTILPGLPFGGFITAQNENFVFRYGLTTGDPDARHPRFLANYPAGGGNYMSNWLIWHMYHGYDATSAGTTSVTVGQGDPRMRFYFYRQTNVNSSNSAEIRCLTETLPSHYPSSTGTAIVDHSIGGRPPLGQGALHPTVDPADPAWDRTFCYPTDKGYWGRDHVDPQGIPPDGLLRTAWGAYPSGGRFDANVNGFVNANIGMRGAGFQPIMMRSFVQFMLSEAALTLTGIVDAVPARTRFQNGIDNSMTDVRDWAVNGTYGTTAVAISPNENATITAFYPPANYTTDAANYRNLALASYDNRVAVSNTVAMNYVAREFWIASFGNGIEAYNLYRRTGQPSGMQPVINPLPTPFPRSFWYPANAANLNSSIDQKTGLDIKVFWNASSTTNLDF